MDDDDRYEGDADVADMMQGGGDKDGGNDSEEIDDEMDFGMNKGGGMEDVDLER